MLCTRGLPGSSVLPGIEGDSVYRVCGVPGLASHRKLSRLLEVRLLQKVEATSLLHLEPF